MFLNDWKVASEIGSAPAREDDVVHELSWGVTGKRILDMSDDPVVFVEGPDGTAEGAEEVVAVALEDTTVLVASTIAELVLVAARESENDMEEEKTDAEGIVVAMVVVVVRVAVDRTLQSGRESAIAGSSENARMSELMRDIAMLRRRHRHDQREQCR